MRGTGKLKAEIETALWELVAAGVVTADGFDNLRSLIDPKRRAGQGSGRSVRPRHSAGRWALLHADAAVERPRAVEAACWMLLRRYGIVIRDLLARESNLPSWRELLMAFRRLEDRGEIRGGRFVDGFLGEQFALPVAVESVRAMRSLPLSGETITLSAADPLNLVGILGARGASAGDFGQDGELSGWGGGGGGVESGGQRGGGIGTGGFKPLVIGFQRGPKGPLFHEQIWQASPGRAAGQRQRLPGKSSAQNLYTESRRVLSR